MNLRLACGLVLVGALAPSHALAQACCATGSGLSPARLGLHDNYGLGMTQRAEWVLGQYDPDGHYASKATGTREFGFAEDLFFAVRWLARGQSAVLVPFVETYRKSHAEASTGGGIGDIVLTLRYDAVLASRYRYIPGFALLGGVTLPTGTPPEAARRPLATDATGRGLLQLSVGVALEKTFGPTIVSFATIAALRRSAAFGGVTLSAAPELRNLGTVAYVFAGEQALGLFGSYAFEGDAEVNGAKAKGSARRELQVGAFAALPLSESFRLRFGLSVHPPLSGLGRNQPAVAASFLGINWSHP